MPVYGLGAVTLVRSRPCRANGIGSPEDAGARKTHKDRSTEGSVLVKVRTNYFQQIPHAMGELCDWAGGAVTATPIPKTVAIANIPAMSRFMTCPSVGYGVSPHDGQPLYGGSGGSPACVYQNAYGAGFAIFAGLLVLFRPIRR